MTNHPTAEQLRAFGLGRLNNAAMDLVSDHVALCDSCCQKLAQVHDDTLVELCKAAGGETEVGDASPMTDEALQEARNALETAFRDHPRYKLRSPLGHGGMGLVYKAEHRLMDRLVAIKVIHPALTANAKAIDRFQREIKAAGNLNHPNIVAALDAEQTGPFHYLVMEFARGVSLDRIVQHRGVLRVPAACRIIQQAAQGLAHADERGMVHRDIKPQNLLATLDGHVKILDFGLARFASDHQASSELTGDGMLGTPEYMAPEQIERANEADIRSDIYSLGCTLYYLLVGQSPFRSNSPADVLMGHLRRKMPSLCEQRQDIPARLEQIVWKMTAKDPDQRLQTPQQVVVAMDEVIRGGPSDAIMPSSGLLMDAGGPESEPCVPIELITHESGTDRVPTNGTPSVADLQVIAAELGESGPTEVTDLASDPLGGATAHPLSHRRLPSRKPRSRVTRNVVFAAIGVGVVGIVILAIALANRNGKTLPPHQQSAGVPKTSSSPIATAKGEKVLLFVPRRYWLADLAPLKAALASNGIMAVETSLSRDVQDTQGQNQKTIDYHVRDVDSTEYAGVVVLGGIVPDTIDPQLRRLLNTFDTRPNQFVAGICMGQVLLDRAGLLANRTVSVLGQHNNVEHIGGRSGGRVHVDGCLITATSDQDVADLAREIGQWIRSHRD